MRDYTQYDDKALLDRLAQSDEAAFNEIYRRYWKLLFSVAADKLGNLYEAEEIVQDVYADLWKRREVIAIKHSIKSFLAAATKYQVVNLLAAKNKQLHIKENLDDLSTEVLPELEYDAKELEQRIHELSVELPERCRLIYNLREEGLTNKQIAASLNISEKTVEGQVTKALRHLKTGLSSFFAFFSF